MPAGGRTPMSGQVRLQALGPVARVTLSHPGKLDAMSRAMWRELREAFLRLQSDGAVRCIVITGENGGFCAGGDIAEYPSFRFEAEALRRFHEEEVWGALAAMLACEVPIVAQLEGACMGAGLEIACCCDLRIAGAFRAVPLVPMSQALTPLALAGLVLMVMSGPLLFSADAVSLARSSTFRWKLALIAVALANALVFRLLWRNKDGEPSALLRLMAVVSLALWLWIAALGRLIAYN